MQGKLIPCLSWGYFMDTSPTLPILLHWNIRRAEMSYSSLLANKDDISEFVFCISWGTEDAQGANNTNGGGDIKWAKGLKEYYSLLIILSRRRKRIKKYESKRLCDWRLIIKQYLFSFHFNLHWRSLMLFRPTYHISLPDDGEDVYEDIMLMRN